MNVKVWSEVSAGLDIAHIELSAFTSQEKSQASEFGPLVINLGGVYTASVTPGGGGSAVAVNFSLEPIKLVIDPSSSMAPVDYDRIFPLSAEYVVPGACANAFCNAALAKITDAYNTWKSQTTAFVVNLNQTLS
jgi:hypothetical protein